MSVDSSSKAFLRIDHSLICNVKNFETDLKITGRLKNQTMGYGRLQMILSDKIYLILLIIENCHVTPANLHYIFALSPM